MLKEIYRQTQNRFKKTGNNTNNNKFAFILCPPFCGSTLLNQFISTSKNVSSNNNKGTREGQNLESTRKMMFDHHDRWNVNRKFDWNFIKKEWLKYWDTESPILLEKSPPNIIRAFEIQDTFSPSFFICMTRNPYARISRDKGKRDLKKVTESVVIQLKYQKKNIEGLNNVIFFTYEEFTNNPKKIKEKLERFLPELNDLDISFTSTAHNYLRKKMKITNLNKGKISKLNQNDLDKINSVLKKEKEILSYFGYKLITKPLMG